MDEKLILAVFHYPELYNASVPKYRCAESRASAWRNISSVVALPSEDCKKKWKNLRDRYIKEVRLEVKNRKEGENQQSKWKYRHLLDFIAPFTGSRSIGLDICGNNDLNNADNDSCSPEGEYTSSSAILKAAMSQSDLKPQFLAQLHPMPQDTTSDPLDLLSKVPLDSTNTGRKRRLMPGGSPSESNTSPTKWLVKENGAGARNKPKDEDELFLLSFVPALKRLSPQRRCETKIRIQQIMYEAEFNISQQPVSGEKLLQTNAQD